MTSTVTESVVSSTTDETDAVDDATQAPYDDEVLAELLIEEISIDGMCGVY
jgi:mycofactocin precursor